MGLDSHGMREPRERLAAFLDRQYRREHRAKRLCEDIGCTPKTAENILSGHWPSSRHWGALVRRFGHDLIQVVFGPEIDQTNARLAAEVRDLEEKLTAKLAHQRQMAGPGARLAVVLVADVDKAAQPRLTLAAGGEG